MIESLKRFFKGQPCQKAWFWAMALFVAALLPRIFTLDSMLNIDAVLYWSERIPRYWRGLATGDVKLTFQTHPGVTLMFASGLSQKLAGVLQAGPSHEFIVAAKLPIVLFSSLLVAANYALLRRLLAPQGEALAILSSLALATEPFVVTQSRALHVDTFFVGFAWLGVLSALLATRELRYRWAILSAVCLGLGLLSRTTCITICVGVALWFIWRFALSRGRENKLSTLLLVLGVTTVLTTVLLWPALLHEPIYTLQNLAEKTTHMVSRGHRQFFMGEIYRKDPGAVYYLALFLLKVSPEMLLGLVAGGFGIVGIVRQPSRRPLLGLFVCYALVVLVLLVSSKKGGRYMFPLYPPLIVLATAGFMDLVGLLGKKLHGPRFAQLAVGLAVVLFAVRGARLAALHPYPVAWCPEYPGLRCEQVITMGGGQGLREVAQYLQKHHPHDAPAKIYDTPYVKGLYPWYRPDIVRKAREAEYLLSYLSERQRGMGTRGIRRYARGQQPVLEVDINGIPYARLFLGPKHPDYGK